MTERKRSRGIMMRISVALLAVGSAMSSPAVGSQESKTQPGEPAAIAAPLGELKAEFAALTRDLVRLEEELLYPPSAQLVVFVCMRVAAPFDLDGMDLFINGRRAAHYLYAQREVDALRRGGVQRLHVGNIAPGANELRAEFKATDAKGKHYHKSVELEIEKTFDPLYVELAITDAASSSHPDLAAVVVR